MSPSHLKVTNDAIIAIQDFHALMRIRGYKMKSITQSAYTDFRYSKTNPITETVISIGMHHGRGKWGPGKAILCLHHLHQQIFDLGFECTKGDPSSTLVYETGEYSEAGAVKHAQMIENIRRFIMNLQ